MISVRLSDDEYQAIKARRGGSYNLSVSEFVRSALLHALTLPDPIPCPSMLGIELATVHSRIDGLDHKIDRIATLAGIVEE
jgi:hypothetical protein